jgi:uncharacterized protein (TIGR02677 family)
MDAERLQVYAYATAPEAADYVTIMRRLTATLLAEWSAQDLIERGLEVRPEIADSRLRYLAAHGNLIESPREVRVSSIAEYQRQPARYSVTAVGAVVHRQVEEVLAASGGAREVPRELLEAVAAGIDRLVHGAHAEGDLSGRELAELVSTIFLQFEAFATAIADFYSYVGAVLARPDLDGDEWLGFKALLLDYLETIVRSVALHTPAIRRGIARLDPMLDDILLRVDAIDPQLNELRSAAGADIDRARGRSRPDWEELRAWFGEDGDRHAGAAQLRAAAGRAVGTLLVHLKRLNAAGTREESMRRHLLRLAGWFGAASPADAHDLFTAAFRLHGARHFGVVLDDEVGALVPATASWWTAPTAPVPVSLIERGDRTSRGRTVRVADHSAQRARLLAGRQRAEVARRGAIGELAAAADRLPEVRLSPDAFGVVLELLASAAADRDGHTGRLVDSGIELRLEQADADHTTVIRSTSGSLTLHGQRPVLIVASRPTAEASA